MPDDEHTGVDRAEAGVAPVTPEWGSSLAYDSTRLRIANHDPNWPEPHEPSGPSGNRTTKR